jgi:hypothetical protein
MLLPTKHLREQKTLIVLGAEVIRLLDEPKTVSRLWESFRRSRSKNSTGVAYDWFVLVLTFLFIVGAVDIKDGRIGRRPK